jgi:hypothetical protein
MSMKRSRKLKEITYKDFLLSTSGRQQHYGVEGLHLLGVRVETVVLISATKDICVD